MILYFSPGACSLADHIAMHEAGLSFDRVRVDLKAKVTEDGHNYLQINPKGYVPALKFDDEQVLTENIAILSWVADQSKALTPEAPNGRYRLLELLAFISTELHKNFKPFFTPGTSDEDKAKAGEMILKRLGIFTDRLTEMDYLTGEKVSVADAYLFVMLMWAQKNNLDLPDPLPAYFARMRARPAVALALEHEGLS